MSPTTLPKLAAALLIFACALVGRTTPVAAQYNYTQIATIPQSAFPVGPLPKINNSGAVFPQGTSLQSGNNNLGINDAGTTMFTTSNGIVTRAAFPPGSPPGPVTLMVPFSQFQFIQSSSLASDGSIVFYNENDGFNPTYAAIYRSDGVNVTMIADTAGPFKLLQRIGPSPPTINSSGVIAFTASTDTSTRTAGGNSAIYISSGGVIQPLYDNSGPFSVFFGGAAINDAGQVAFVASLDDSSAGIFRGFGGTYETVVTGIVNAGQNVSINNLGDVAFATTSNFSNNSLHIVDSDMTTHVVISTGDSLFGSTVTGLAFVTSGQLNDQGQLAFQYRLQDGRYGVALATPVPEPSAFFLAALGTLIFCSKTRQQVAVSLHQS